MIEYNKIAQKKVKFLRSPLQTLSQTTARHNARCNVIQIWFESSHESSAQSMSVFRDVDIGFDFFLFTLLKKFDSKHQCFWNVKRIRFWAEWSCIRILICGSGNFYSICCFLFSADPARLHQEREAVLRREVLVRVAQHNVPQGHSSRLHSHRCVQGWVVGVFKLTDYVFHF